METDESSRVSPPYIPLMTLENFAGKLKAAVVPPVIDSSLTQSMSGGMAGALMSALKFLGLVDASGKSHESLKKLVAAHGTDAWKTTQADLLLPAYNSIIGDLDLLTSTPAMLEECFRKRTKVSGQVLDKAIRFFLGIMTAANRPVSPLLKTRKPRTASGPRKAGRSAARKPVTPETEDEYEHDDEDAGGARSEILKLRLPIPGRQEAVVFIAPKDLTVADWQFLQPIFIQYVERMLKANENL